MPEGTNHSGEKAAVAVLGGSGLYEMEEVRVLEELEVETPFGPPSDRIVVGELRGVRVAFLPRHGRGHRILPSEINQRANMWALRSLGVGQVIALSAVGSLREDLPPRTFVFPDQLVDETVGRPSTFFGEGCVGHVALARPFCGGLSSVLQEAARKLGLQTSVGGVYCCMEGPQFSTKAASEMHRRQGYSLIGMTASPECRLAREAELCYQPVAMVTDYDCWKEEDEVSTEKVVEHLMANAANAKRLVAEAVGAVASRRRGCECVDALKGNVFTRPEAIPIETYRRLELLISRHVPAPKA